MIVQAIGLLDDLDKELNTYAMRVREWYGWHFPEMTRVVNDNLQYAKTVRAPRPAHVLASMLPSAGSRQHGPGSGFHNGCPHTISNQTRTRHAHVSSSSQQTLGCCRLLLSCTAPCPCCSASARSRPPQPAIVLSDLTRPNGSRHDCSVWSIQALFFHYQENARVHLRFLLSLRLESLPKSLVLRVL